MADRNDGGPAFPGFAYTDGRGACRVGASGEFEYFVGGMSVRDYAVIKLMAAMTGPKWPEDGDWSEIARRAGLGADWMLAEREKSRG